MRHLLPLFCLIAPLLVSAAQVTVLGVMGNKAIVSIDGGRQQILSPGQRTPEGVKLLSVGKEDASFEIDGKVRRLAMGDVAFQSDATPARPGSVSGGSASIVLDSSGRFVAPLKINGFDTQGVVDFKSSLITLNANEAKRLGIDIRAGNRVLASKATGMAAAFRVKVRQLKLGGITLENLDAIVNEGSNPPVILLGGNLLSRLDVRREGNILMLSKPY